MGINAKDRVLTLLQSYLLELPIEKRFFCYIICLNSINSLYEGCASVSVREERKISSHSFCFRLMNWSLVLLEPSCSTLSKDIIRKSMFRRVPRVKTTVIRG